MRRGCNDGRANEARRERNPIFALPDPLRLETRSFYLVTSRAVHSAPNDSQILFPGSREERTAAVIQQDPPARIFVGDHEVCRVRGGESKETFPARRNAIREKGHIGVRVSFQSKRSAGRNCFLLHMQSGGGRGRADAHSASGVRNVASIG